jgi:metal-responsive CopG/Arc/MetJ family transcriptional regulator
MTQVVVCIKMKEEEKDALDAFSKKVTGGNRSKAIKDALRDYMARITQKV